MLPSSLLYKYIRMKRIKVNQKRTTISYRLEQGDIIELYINDEFFEKPDEDTAFLKLEPKISILYEDDNIILIDKKPGMIVHSDEAEKVNTLITHLKAYLYQSGSYHPENENSFVPALCNRIDRNTGGIVIAAKNAEALRVINEKIKNREIKKFYICLVHGLLKEKKGVLTAHLFKDSVQNKVYVYDQ
ncbi:MAG: pseudouridine synthase, partial [Bacteroidales bacterium]|nr:pseudouridine synthase [Bacteroidales bacterium]